MPVRVPVVVTGEPDTLNRLGRLRATLVTDPTPAPVAAHVPSPRRKLLALGVPEPNRAGAITPAVTFDPAMFGTPVITIDGVEVALLTEKLSPLTPLVAETCVTVPPPAGVAHTPSPRQKVDEEALAPELRFATGKFPLTSDARLTDPCVLSTPPVAFTQPDSVNRPICLPVVLEKTAA